MKVKKVIRGAVAVTVIAACYSYAARPFGTDDAGIVPAGTFECEIAGDYWKNSSAFGAGLKHGLTDRMDIGVSVGGVMHPSEEQAIEPVELGLKFGLIPDLLAFSVAGSFSDPAYSANLIVSKDIRKVSLHGNIGYAAVGTTTDADFTWGVCSRLNLGRFSPGVELMGTHEEVSCWHTGGQFSIKDWIAVDAGIGSDFAEEKTFTATTGLWFAFPVTKEKGE